MNIPEVPMSARRLQWVAPVLLAAFVFTGTASSADEKEIPKKVMDALKAKFPKAEIHKWTKEKEGDAVVYDIEFKENGRKCEADIKEDGTYVNYEREIAAKDLPKAVTDAVEKKYPKATMKEIMEIMEVKGKEDKLEGYEIVLVTADKKEVEVTIAPDGKVLEDSTEEKKKEEKK
jgi:preprotein translocase subunit SecD